MFSQLNVSQHANVTERKRSFTVHLEVTSYQLSPCLKQLNLSVNFKLLVKMSTAKQTAVNNIRNELSK